MSESDVKEIKGISDLSFDPTNANSGTPRGQQMVEDSLRTYGAGRSILVDKNGVAIAGNKTLQASADIELPIRVIQTDGHELVVVQRTDLDLATDPRARELGLVDNRSSEVGLEWNIEVLASMKSEGVATEKLWTEKEWNLLVPETPGSADAEPQIDKADELQKKWGTETGQLWTIGNHRLLIGDSANKTDVDRLCAPGNALNLIVTSPPYNQSLTSQSAPTGMHSDNKWFHRLEGAYADEMPEPDYQKWQVELLTMWFDFSAPGAALFYNHKHRYRERRPIIPLDWLRLTPWELRQEIIWDRRGGVAANAGMFIPGDERLYWMEKDGPHVWNGVGDNRTTVWPINPQVNNGLHVCPFPLDLAETSIRHVTNPDAIVGEPYAGSGTTLVASQNLSRRCLAMEISPAYAAVCLQRMEDAFGITGVIEKAPA